MRHRALKVDGRFSDRLYPVRRQENGIIEKIARHTEAPDARHTVLARIDPRLEVAHRLILGGVIDSDMVIDARPLRHAVLQDDQLGGGRDHGGDGGSPRPIV